MSIFCFPQSLRYPDRFISSHSNASTIPTHPRQLTSTVRRTDTTRKDARERRKERKEEELLKKKEEVKRMKALKMKEVRERLEMIKREGGKSVREDGEICATILLCSWI